MAVSRDAAADNLFVVMQQAFTEDPSKKFIRAVNAAPEPAVVVASYSFQEILCKLSFLFVYIDWPVSGIGMC